MTRTTTNIRVLAIAVALLCAIGFMPLLADSMQSHAAAKVKVDKASVTVQVGSSATVTAKGLKAKQLKKVTWKSSKTTVANITKAKGKSIDIQGISEGTATITAKYGKKTAKVKVTVEAAPAADPSLNKTVNPNGYVKEGDIYVTGYAQGDATVYALLYQESAEVAAMQMQAFSLAKIRIDDAIAANTDNKPLAIVTDIDSTIADDTCYIAGAVLDAAGRIGVKYFATELEPWVNDDWCGYYQAVATTADTVIPGAKQFVDYTYSKGIEWYYITNRPYYELDLTVKQLENQGFFEKYDPTKSGLGYTNSIVKDYAKVNNYQEYHYPGWYGADATENAALDNAVAEYAAKVNAPDTGMEMTAGSYSVKDDYRVQVQGTDFASDKAARRANVEKRIADAGGKVVLYMGDSINDMVSDTDTKDFTRGQLNETRTANASKVEWAGDWGTGQSVSDTNYNPGHWGYDYIVLPNATYGDWYKTTWANNKVDGVSGKGLENQQKAIYNQIWSHSYLNPKFKTWYPGTGNSPVTNVVQ